jgi:hypothetical protein
MMASEIAGSSSKTKQNERDNRKKGRHDHRI